MFVMRVEIMVVMMESGIRQQAALHRKMQSQNRPESSLLDTRGLLVRVGLGQKGKNKTCPEVRRGC